MVEYKQLGRTNMNPINLQYDLELRGLLNDSSFSTYYDNLIKTNKVMNLTNITEEKEVYLKHFYDSVILIKAFELKNKSILDIGAGAGFPSIPIKLLERTLKVTIVDGLNKRINFLKDLVNILQLNDINLLHSRAEDLDKKMKYDFVTARAVARLNILAELALPYVKIGGYFIAYKSINYQEELDEAVPGINKLGGSLDKIIVYELSPELKHVLLVIKKVKETPIIYPRQFGKIKKSPL